MEEGEGIEVLNMSSWWITENHDYERSCMITCALSGVVANRAQCPAIPYTPEEYAAEARRAWEAGAAVVHLHARQPDGTPSCEVEDYRNIYEAVTAACPVIINFSTGAVGISVDKKIAPVTAVKPAIAALNMGSMNYAKYHPRKKSFIFDFVFSNPFSEIVPLVSAMKEQGVKPEMECFDSGHIGNCFPLIDLGLLDPPYQFSLILGVLGGMPPTAENLAHQVRILPPQSDWEVIGIGLDQWRMVAAAVALGGNVRVGLEDNFYVTPEEMAHSNGDLVEKAARMIRDQGRQVATVDECRQRLGLKHQ
jgi:3-keto-5-aminohexanoate cleavage enzyme